MVVVRNMTFNEFLSGAYVLEWSESQGAYHIETIKEAVIRNYAAHCFAEQNDYVVIYVGDCYAECEQFAKIAETSRSETLSMMEESGRDVGKWR